MGHKNWNKWDDKARYLGNWLRNEVERSPQPPSANGRRPARRGLYNGYDSEAEYMASLEEGKQVREAQWAEADAQVARERAAERTSTVQVQTSDVRRTKEKEST